MKRPYSERINRIQQNLQKQNSAAALVFPGPNLQYFTGFRGEPPDRFHAFYMPREGEPTMISPYSYQTQIKKNSVIQSIETIADNNPKQVASAILGHLKELDQTVLVDDNAFQAVTAHLYNSLGSEMVSSASPLFSSLRCQKDNMEIAALQRSAEVADAVSVEIRSLGANAIGLTEAELATKVREGLHRRGATGVSFDVVVSAGSNSADPALRHSNREIKANEPVVLDFGCFLDGYASDQSRTVIFDGVPPKKFERVHKAVKTALNAGVDAVEPKVTASHIDKIVRSKLDEYGYAEKFIHPTGHGVGLASHEALTINKGVTTELKPGMVFSIEPGVYLDKYGVRIEDLVVVTEDGSKRLNHSPRIWRPTIESNIP